MRFRFDKLIVVALVAVLACSVFICVWPSDTQEEYSVTGQVIGLSSYNQPKLDVKADEMKECEVRAFCNLYHIQIDSEEYRAVVDCTYCRNMYLIANPDQIPNIFEIDWNNIDVSSVDTYSAAYSYCTDYLGFSDGEVSDLVTKLCY